LAFEFLPRRSTSPAAAGRFGHIVKCARIWRHELGAATQQHFIRVSCALGLDPLPERAIDVHLAACQEAERPRRFQSFGGPSAR
jgi:hypothetical protein